MLVYRIPSLWYSVIIFCSNAHRESGLRYKCWLKCRTTRVLTHCWHGCKMAQIWETLWPFLKKLNMYLLYDPAILLLNIYWRKGKEYLYTMTLQLIGMDSYYKTRIVDSRPLAARKQERQEGRSQKGMRKVWGEIHNYYLGCDAHFMDVLI